MYEYGPRALVDAFECPDAPECPDGPEWDVDDVLTGTVPVSEVLADCVSGSAGAGRVQMLATVDPAALSAAQRIDYLVALERQSRWLHAERLRVLAVIDQADGSEDHWSTEEVACALRVSARYAGYEAHTANTLTSDLPQTLRALSRGEISARHAAAVAEHALVVAPELRGELESRVLGRAPVQTVAEFRRSLARAAIRVDADAAARRSARAARERRVELRAGLDGMCELRAILPAVDAAAMWTRLTAGADALPADDERSIGEKRADLLVDAVLRGVGGGALPTRQGRQPRVGVVVGLSTLMGLDDEPADLAGQGPIPADVARRLATEPDATWQRFVTDPVTGHLLDCGRSYQPSQAMRDFVVTRDGICSAVGCRQPAWRCDLDHRRPFDDGGSTRPDNLHPLCRRHHRMKTHAGWSIGDGPDGERVWTSPTGHQYVKQTDQPWAAPNESALPEKSAAPEKSAPLEALLPENPSQSWSDSADDEPPF